MTADASVSYEQIKRDDNLTVVELLDSIDDVVEAVLDIFVPRERSIPNSDEAKTTHRTVIPLKKSPQNQRGLFKKSQSNPTISTNVENSEKQKVISPLMYAQKIGNDTANWISSKGNLIEAEAGKINLSVPFFGVNSPTSKSPSMPSKKQNIEKSEKEENQNTDKVTWSVSSFGLESPQQEEVQVKYERKKRWFQRKKASSVKNIYDNQEIDDDKSETDFWDAVLDIVSPASKDAEEEEVQIKKKNGKLFRRSKRKNSKNVNGNAIVEDRDDISQVSSMKSVFGGTRV